MATDSPHPDDEAISTWIDGEPVELSGHDECAECLERAGALRAAARWVASPPSEAVDPGPAITKAIAVRGEPFVRRTDREAVPGRTDRVPRRWAVAGLAAAALVASVLAVVGTTSRGERHETNEASPRPAVPVAEGGDLGSFDDPRALAEAVRPTLAPGTASLADQATPTTAVAPKAQGRVVATTSACDVASAEYSGGGVLVYRARARWEGTSAVVLGYHLDVPQLANRVVVVDRSDCRLLIVQSF